MQKGIIGKKLGMTQLFDANGKVVPVTIIEAGPCTVVQKKTVESDGYQAVQMGYGEVSAKKVNKAAIRAGCRGHSSSAPPRPASASCRGFQGWSRPSYRCRFYRRGHTTGSGWGSGRYAQR